MTPKRLLFAFAFGLVLTSAVSMQAADKKPNVVYFLVDNLGMGELSCYSGGPLRGTMTPRIGEVEKHESLL